MKGVQKMVLLLGMAIVALPQLLRAQHSDSTSITERVDTIQYSIVEADKAPDRNMTQTGLQRIDKDRIQRGFALFSTPDIIKTIQMMPGVASGTELMSGLYVHGGDGSDNLFLLDGVPMYQVSHIGGLFSSFNTDIVENLDFYKSGFPGRYGGRLSSVVDVRTEDGGFQKYKGSFSVGLIDGRLQFDGPIVKDKLSFNVAARRSWLDLITLPIFAISNLHQDEKTSASYGFYDANASLKWIVDSRSNLAARFYIGSDDLKMKEKMKERDEGQTIASQEIGGKIRWGNILASLNWQTRFTSNLRLDALLYYTLSRSRIGAQISSWEIEDGMRQGSSIEDWNISNVDEVGSRVDLYWKPHENHIIRAGVNYSWAHYNPGREYDIQADGMRLSGGNTVDYSSHNLSLYAEDEMSLTPWLKMNVGLRYSPTFVPQKVWHSLEPRAALTFVCGNLLSIKASYARMSQQSHLISTSFFDLPTNCWLPSTRTVRPSISDQVAGGFYFTLPMNFILNIEGYWKTMNHILLYGGQSSLFPPLDSWETSFKSGRGKSYGLETELTYRTKKVDASIFYTLSWSRRNFPFVWNDWFLDRNDSRHKLTLLGTWRINSKIDIYAAWNYYTGTRLTTREYQMTSTTDTQDFYGCPNNLKLPDYHRLDLGVNIHRKTRRGNESIWNISIYNVYCRMNAFSAYVDQGDNGEYVGHAMGLIPIIPTFSYTLKFNIPKKQ